MEHTVAVALAVGHREVDAQGDPDPERVGERVTDGLVVKVAVRVGDREWLGDAV